MKETKKYNIGKGGEFGLKYHDYLTKIRKQKLKVGDLPKEHNSLEKELGELDKVGWIVSHIASFVKNPIRDYVNISYAIIHLG